VEPALIVTTAVAALSVVGAIAPRVGRWLVEWSPRGAIAGLAAVLLAVAALTVGPARAEVPPPPVRITARQASPPHAREHTVVAGECLWRIARHYLAEWSAEPTSADVAHFWPRIYEANHQVIGDDPDLILVGQVLTIPEV
jgi:nucleoid-associated protein YgaU